MALEQQQVNVQEIQRLNDAITITLDAIRRVVPQLAMLQQQQLMQHLVGQQYGVPFGGYGMGMQQQHQMLPYLLAQLAGQQQMPFGGIGQQLGGMGQNMPFGGIGHLLGSLGQQGFGGIGQQGFGGIGQQGFGGIGQQGFGGIGQQGFGGMMPWLQQFGGMQQPFGARPF